MELSQVFQALRNADAAGDTEAAKRLAQIARGMMAEGLELDESDTKKEKTKEDETIEMLAKNLEVSQREIKMYSELVESW